MLSKTHPKKAYLRFLTIVCLMAACLNAQEPTEEPSNIEVTVTNPPRDGVEVGGSITVEGTASLPSGHHLWVFARRTDFEPLWWPQKEGKVNPITGRWKVQAHIGMPRDVGWNFDIAVAVFKEREHFILRDYLHKAVKSGDFRPLEMPEITGVPQIFQVVKESHR